MKKKDVITIMVLVIICIGGFFATKWWPICGGFVAGCSCTLLLFCTIGQWQLNQAAKRIDKNMKDFYIQQ